MVWPDFNELGDLPVGRHRAKIADVVAHFGHGIGQRGTVTARLERIYSFPKSFVPPFMLRLHPAGYAQHERGQKPLVLSPATTLRTGYAQRSRRVRTTAYDSTHLGSLYELAQHTGCLQRFLIFGSYVTAEPNPHDVAEGGSQ
jgi:hypothetical protein